MEVRPYLLTMYISWKSLFPKEVMSEIDKKMNVIKDKVEMNIIQNDYNSN